MRKNNKTKFRIKIEEREKAHAYLWSVERWTHFDGDDKWAWHFIIKYDDNGNLVKYEGWSSTFPEALRHARDAKQEIIKKLRFPDAYYTEEFEI